MKFYRHRIITVVIVVMITVLIAPPPQTEGGRFVLAGWDGLDQYGQGIFAVTVYQNISGQWINMRNMYAFNSTIVEINATDSIKVQVRCWLNNTLVGTASLEDGKNYIRHTADLYNASILIMTEQNGTCVYQNDYVGGTMFMYYYDLILEFIPLAGQIYIVVLTYEIYSEG